MGDKVLIKNVVCPFCGSNCDDIEVEVQDNKILNVYNACSLGASVFLPIPGVKRFTKPLWRENKTDEFKEISWDEAFDKFAEIMLNARKPLYFGWCEESVEAIRQGVKIAEITKGIIDSQITHCHGPSLQAIQMVGYPTCTLGDIKNRADCVVFWGCNPLNGHPRHLARYSGFPRGFFREDGRSDKTIIVVDPRHSDTAKIADYYYQVALGEDYEIFQALRAVINGMELERDVIGGLKKEEIVEMADILKSASFGIIFFGMGLTHSLGKSQNVSSAIELTQLLNEPSKWQIMPLMGHYNVNGFAQVLSWTTGYPYAVDFSRGYPRYNPGEYTSIDLLVDGQIDAMFITSADPGSHMPQKAVKQMVKIPIISCEIHPTSTTQIANLIIPGTENGIECEASCYRMDAVPLRMKKIKDPPDGCMPSDEQIFKEIFRVIKAKIENKA
ncbi:MAG: formylmethanofuran dehydrogenase subunit B [Promethearchaeota archaeon]